MVELLARQPNLQANVMQGVRRGKSLSESVVGTIDLSNRSVLTLWERGLNVRQRVRGNDRHH
jgi:hypothetical protein